jgi:uncharacterized protein
VHHERSYSLSKDIQGLADLAQLDSAIAEMDEAIKKSRTEVSTLETALAASDAKIAASAKQTEALEKQKKEAEVDVRSMHQQIDHSRDKLGRSRTERETNAVQREMEELRRLIRDREIEVEKIHGSLHAIETAMQTEKEAGNKTREELGALKGPAGDQLSLLDAERAEKIASREACSKAISPVIFRKYETIRLKRGSGLTTTTDGTCKSCHIALAPQMYHRIRREALLDQCPNCNRLIYFVAVAAAPAPAV